MCVGKCQALSRGCGDLCMVSFVHIWDFPARSSLPYMQPHPWCFPLTLELPPALLSESCASAFQPPVPPASERQYSAAWSLYTFQLVGYLQGEHEVGHLNLLGNICHIPWQFGMWVTWEGYVRTTFQRYCPQTRLPNLCFPSWSRKFGKEMRFRRVLANCPERNRSWSNSSPLPGCETGTMKGKSVGSWVWRLDGQPCESWQPWVRLWDSLRRSQGHPDRGSSAAFQGLWGLLAGVVPAPHAPKHCHSLVSYVSFERVFLIRAQT